MALSDQLTDLAAPTKRLEDTAPDTEAKNRAKLEEDRENLHTQVTNEAKQIQKSADDARASADAWWESLAGQIEMGPPTFDPGSTSARRRKQIGTPMTPRVTPKAWWRWLPTPSTQPSTRCRRGDRSGGG